ncbi:hypothetical protein Sjap_010718 [Stephania japonica]|uniref:Uncharacterized protein n=1 Tax=Stephania japonica TaxID=461633 RepID=A0AAP0JC00_9MAGN
MAEFACAINHVCQMVNLTLDHVMLILEDGNEVKAFEKASHLSDRRRKGPCVSHVVSATVGCAIKSFAGCQNSESISSWAIIYCNTPWNPFL